MKRMLIIGKLGFSLWLQSAWLIQPALAQEKPTRPKHIVSLHLTQLIVREVQLSYERSLSKRWSVEGMLGWQRPNRNVDDVTVPGDFFYLKINDGMEIGKFTQSVYAGVGLRYYFLWGNKISPYLASNVFYRESHYDNKLVEVVSGGSSAGRVKTQLSQKQEIWGARVVFGVRLPSLKIGKIGLALEAFTGICLRTRAAKSTIYGSSTGYGSVRFYSEPMYTEEKDIQPSMPLGIKLGVSW